MRKIALIVPCYNEAKRLDREGFAALCRIADLLTLFVNDGSTDDTETCLRSLCQDSEGATELLSLEKNQGKGEAVRRGMMHALAAGAEIVGYMDADLSTPIDEIHRMISILDRDHLSLVMGSRIRYLGSTIERSAGRHYVGRVFATISSFILKVPVYDTQCGAKLFLRTPILEQSLAEPFISRWCFDVELLGRLLIGAGDVRPLRLEQIREVPLNHWRHMPGSKLGLINAIEIFYDLVRVAMDLSSRRRRLKERDYTEE